MDASSLIDQRIKELGDWRGKKILELREILHEADPAITEDWKWGSPVFIHDGLVCSIGSFKNHVKLHFFKGAEILDSGKIFNAGLEAKTTRGIDFFENDKIDRSAVIEMITRAIKHNIK